MAKIARKAITLLPTIVPPLPPLVSTVGAILEMPDSIAETPPKMLCVANEKAALIALDTVPITFVERDE